MWPTDLRRGERKVCASLCFSPQRVEGLWVKCGGVVDDEVPGTTLDAGELGVLDPGDEDGEEVPVECEESEGV